MIALFPALAPWRVPLALLLLVVVTGLTRFGHDGRLLFAGLRRASRHQPAPDGTGESPSAMTRYSPAMAHITGHVHIAVPPEQVFDSVADARNEPSYNPSMTDAELLTPLPLGPGTQFRARMGRSKMEMLVELTEFDRPHRLGSHTASAIMETSGVITFAPDGRHTIMSWNWQVHPKGWLRLLGPLLGPAGARMERTIWTGLKQHLENGTARRLS